MIDRYGVEAQILPEDGEMEQWVPAPGYEDRYEVSSFGNLRNKKTGQLRKICDDNGGYPKVCLKIDGKVHCVYLHRLVCEAFNGAPTLENNVCDHIDRCIINNYYKNLHWTDHSGNRLNSSGKKRKFKFSFKKTPIVFLDLNGKFIQRFDNILQAHNILNISEQQIYQNLIGHRKPFKNGYFKTEADYLTFFDK